MVGGDWRGNRNKFNREEDRILQSNLAQPATIRVAINRSETYLRGLMDAALITESRSGILKGRILDEKRALKRLRETLESAVPVLTDRQGEILCFISSYVGEHGYPPSFADIRDEFLIRMNAVEGHIVALVKKGAITHDQGKARTIRIL